MPSIKEQTISKYDNTKTMLSNAYARVLPAFPDLSTLSVAELYALEEEYRKRFTQISGMKPPPFRYDATGEINSQFDGKINEWKAKKELVEAQYAEKKKALEDDHTNAVASATQKASAGVQPLIDKHKELMSYKDAIEDICQKYSISPTDIQISADISAAEYNALLDAALIGCKSMVKQKSSKFNPINLLYKPLEWNGQVEKQLGAIVLFCVAFHLCGGLITALFFGAILASTIGVYKKLDKLKIAESMMYTPDFDKFMVRDEIEAIADVDTTEIDKWREEELAKLDENNPEAEKSAALREYAAACVEIDEHVNAGQKELEGIHAKVLDECRQRLDKVVAAKDEAVAKQKKFGDTMLDETPKCYPSYKYVLGKLNPVVDERISVPVANYAFTPSDDMPNFLKIMLCNTLLDMKAKKLTAIIYDPEGLGRDFSEFLHRNGDTHDFIKVATEKLEDIFRQAKEDVSTAIRLCGKRTLDEVNAESEEKGMVTRDYTLIILYSGYKEWTKKPESIEFLKTCFKYGIRVWIYGEYEGEGVHVFSKPYDTLQITEPYPYSFELGSHCTDTFADAIANSKDGSIDYFTSIQEKYIPREKWGTWSTNKGIDLNFGLADGDPSKGFPMVLGDANVHLLMAGQSGAGKSAAINQMLLSLLCKYSPKELMLVMIDFKNVEFSTFTKPDPKSDGKLSIIPHARIMAGTKDGEYALSIFDFLIAEMEHRQKVFGDVQQKKLEDYNNLMREQGHPEKCLPRILLLIDEFQVMFTEVDRKIVDVIQDRIRSLAKLARAFGCHMWFTSQSMSGTMSADVKANFSMRAALRCTKEVSTEIIGNGASGTIKAKFGYLYTNDSTGQDPTRNILWRVPFVSTKNILKTMNEAAALYESWGIQGYNAEFYDEDQQHKDKELFDFYKDNESNEKVTNPHLLVLGKRTNFSTNNAPVNFYLEKGDYNNVAIGALEDADMLNLCRTIIDNCQAHGIKYVISCADEDAHTLLELDERLSGPYLDWSYPSTPFTDWADKERSPIVKLINKRIESGDTEFKPVYFIMYNWDKYPGFGVAENSRVLEQWKELMRVGPTVDVHFVLIIRNKGELSNSMFTLFKHRICALSDETVSIKMLDNAKGTKLNPKGGFAIYKVGQKEIKFKIYQHTFARKLADKELTL